MESLRAEAAGIIRRIQTEKDYTGPQGPPLALVPTELDIADIWQIIEHEKPDDRLGKAENVLIVLSCLRARPLIPIDEDDLEPALSLYQWASEAALPGVEFAQVLEETYLGQACDCSSHTIRLAKFKCRSALGVIACLAAVTLPRAFDKISTAHISTIITTLAAHFSDGLPWVDPRLENRRNSPETDVLHKWLPPSDNGYVSASAFAEILRSILQTHIKPLFARAPNANITAAGRKNFYHGPDPQFTTFNDAESKPWNYDSVWAVPVLEWLIPQYDHLTLETLDAHFHLLVPPILNLIDDTSVAFKSKGCDLLSMLCARLSQEHVPIEKNLLRKTGLDEVFEDALMACTLYLPTLTPDDESTLLLQKTYSALAALRQARWPQGLTAKDDAVEERMRIRTLEGVMSKGLLPGLTHVGLDHPTVAGVLIEEVARVVNALGVTSVRYLQTLIPLLTSPLTSPFATATPPLLITALQTLQSILTPCAPRIPLYEADILSGLTFCWLRIIEEEDGKDGGGQEKSKKEREEVKESLKECLRVLEDVVGIVGRLRERGEVGEIDGRGDADWATADPAEVLVKADERLAGLFG